MALTAANPGGWSLNEVLTSVQMTFLQNELLKAIDGVGGGTYTLGAPLEFAGADVRIAADLEVLSTGAINVQNGGELNVLSGGVANVGVGASLAVSGGLTLEPGSTLTAQNTAAATFVSGSSLAFATGSILNVNSGGRVDLNNGSEMHVEGTATLDIEGSGGLNVTTGGFLRIRTGGDLRVESGGDVVVENGATVLLQSGGAIVGQTGSTVTLEDAEDLLINAAPVGFRHTLVPAFNDNVFPWSRTSDASGVLGWYQTDVAARRSIWFAMAVPPGDTIVDVYLGLDGDEMGGGHGGVAPTTQATLELVTVAVDGTVTTQATRDGNEPGATYDANHFLLLSAGSITTGAMPFLVGTDPVYLRVRGEFGGSAAPGLTIQSISGNLIARSYRPANEFYS